MVTKKRKRDNGAELLQAIHTQNVQETRSRLTDPLLDNESLHEGVKLAEKIYNSARQIGQAMYSHFECSVRGIDQQYQACAFAAALTLCYRIRPLYNNMHRDIRTMVDSCCKHRYTMPRPNAFNVCPLVPALFPDMYWTISARKHVYSQNVATEVLQTMFRYSRRHLEELESDQDTIADLKGWVKGVKIYPTRGTGWRMLCLGPMKYTNQNAPHIYKFLRSLCFRVSACGGIINAFEGSPKKLKGGHSWAFTVCRNRGLYACSRGDCWLMKGNIGLDSEHLKTSSVQFIILIQNGQGQG